MGRWVTRSWQSTYDGGLRRRDRRSGEYVAYIPDPLVGASLALTPETEGLAAQAEVRARAVNASPDLVRIGRFLLRSEAIASSRIEGIAPSAYKIALAELGQQEEIKGLSEQARSVAHNMTLVRRAMEELSDSRPMTREHLVALHRSLVPDSPEHHGIRVVQNWLGGSSYHPLDADFVPPPADLLPSLIDDLLEYLRRNPRSTNPGCARARPIRDDPPFHRRQRSRWPGPHSRDAGTPRPAHRAGSTDEPRPGNAR